MSWWYAAGENSLSAAALCNSHTSTPIDVKSVKFDWSCLLLSVKSVLIVGSLTIYSKIGGLRLFLAKLLEVGIMNRSPNISSTKPRTCNSLFLALLVFAQLSLSRACLHDVLNCCGSGSSF